MRTLPIVLGMTLAAGAATTDIDSAIRRDMTRDHVPGLSLAVVRGGRIVKTGAYGYANLEWQTPVTVDTKFEIASISKMFAGAAARILIEENRLDPEDQLTKYFEGMPESWAGMKVRHLITMSSGLPEDFGGETIPYDADVIKPDDDASLLRSFFTLKMPGRVGERFVYSSANYAMIGMIVSKVAGVPFARFVQERIFTPAGMTDSSYIDNAAIVPRRADGYRREQNGDLKKGRYLGQYLHSRPDDGVLTTARDLARWAIALEGGKILRDPQPLWTPTRADSGRALDYAYGWIADTWLGHRRAEHAGGYRTGFHTYLARYPDDDLTVIVLTNCDFSAVRNYVNLVARAYIPGVPDPAAESAKPDADPAATQRLAAAMQGLARGTLDESVLHADAVDPIGVDEVADFLKGAGPFTYAGRGRLKEGALSMHGRALVDYETLKTQIGKNTYYLTLYRDAAGKVAYLEPTN
jgi:CubicO group peptidase (beta-lactamase class C family)